MVLQERKKQAGRDGREVSGEGKSQPTRPASLALFFFFALVRETVHLLTVKIIPDYRGASWIQTESPGRPYESPLLFSGEYYWNHKYLTIIL